MKTFLLSSILLSAILISCNNNDAEKAEKKVDKSLSDYYVNQVADSLIKANPDIPAEEIEKGVSQSGEFWMENNSTKKEFISFISKNFISKLTERNKTINVNLNKKLINCVKDPDKYCKSYSLTERINIYNNHILRKPIKYEAKSYDFMKYNGTYILKTVNICDLSLYDSLYVHNRLLELKKWADDNKVLIEFFFPIEKQKRLLLSIKIEYSFEMNPNITKIPFHRLTYSSKIKNSFLEKYYQKSIENFDEKTIKIIDKESKKTFENIFNTISSSFNDFNYYYRLQAYEFMNKANWESRLYEGKSETPYGIQSRPREDELPDLDNHPSTDNAVLFDDLNAQLFYWLITNKI